MKVSLVSVPVKDPIKAPEISTSKLGFTSKKFDPDSKIAIIFSAQDPKGTAILLKPCIGSIAENYHKSAYEANLPIIVFSVKNVNAELKRLKHAGIKHRPELDNHKRGLMNMFEDECGNRIMIE